jgi:tetratricopeptide (TPR) repeat protein
MKTGLLLALLAFLTVSCGRDRQIGVRYRAERELWRAQGEQRSLSIRPGQAGEDQWRALAARYEAIADRYGSPVGSARGSVGDPDVRTVAARALFAAIQINGGLQDSIQVERIYQRMAQNFDDLPPVAAEVALARGQIAERRGEMGAAADLYQTVVDRIPPRSGATGIASAVLDLPLRIAQLRSQGAPGGVATDAYAAARTYYERLAGDVVSDTVQCDSRVLLAEIASDLREWDRATQILNRLEEQLRAAAKPARPPCEIRFAIAGIQSRTGADPEVARATLTSLLQDYPDCAFASQALLVLANNARERGRLDEALGYLERVVKEHADDPDDASQALLARARLLELNHRWSEALEAYRGLSVQFPISMAAVLAPLEIAMHYSRAGEREATATALQQAERDYRSLIRRYPARSLTYAARERLVQTLALQQKYDAAIAELMGMGDELKGTSRGASLMIAAARMAFADMRDTTQAITILDRTADLYADAAVGRWASGEAQRLRGTMAR